jgi:hypothetical protein
MSIIVIIPRWQRICLAFKIEASEALFLCGHYETVHQRQKFSLESFQGVPVKVTVKRAGQDKEVQDLIDLALCRQETFHGRLRNFAILRNCFKNGKSTEDEMEIHETV